MDSLTLILRHLLYRLDSQDLLILLFFLNPVIIYLAIKNTRFKSNALDLTLITFTMLIILSTELLGFFNLLSSHSITALNIGILITLISLNSKTIWKIQFNRFRNFHLHFYHIIFISILIFPIIKLVTGIVIPPNLWDGMTYHLPRIFHWLYQSNLSFFETDNVRQNISPYLGSIFMLHYYSLTHNDHFLFFNSFIPAMLSFYKIFVIVQRFKMSRLLHYYFLILSIFIPVIITSLDSVQENFYGLLLFLIGLNIFLNVEKLNSVTLFVLMSLVPLFILTKTQSLIFYVPLFIITFYKFKDQLKQFMNISFGWLVIPYLIAIPFIFRLVNYFYTFDLRSMKFLPNNTSFMPPVFISPDILFDKSLFSNILKNIGLLIQTPSNRLNSYLYSCMEFIFQKFRLDINDNSINFYNNPFSLSSEINLDLVGNFLYVILFILIFSYFIFYRFFLKRKVSGSLFIIFFAQMFTYVALFRWQPWGNRFLYIPIVLIVICAASIYPNVSKIAKLFILLVSLPSLVFGLFLSLHNPSRSILDSTYLGSTAPRFSYSSSLSTDFTNQVPIAYGNYWDESTQIIDFLHQNNEKGAYLYLGESGYEYPLWRAGNFSYRFPHFKLNLDQSSYKYLICNYTCDSLNSQITIIKQLNYYNLAVLN